MATQPCLTVACASPLRVGGGSRRAGAGVRRGEALRLRERAHARVAACASGARGGGELPPVACRRGWWGGPRRPFPSPRRFPLPRLERLSARSRHTGAQPTGVLRGHGRGPACPRGALRPGRESPSGSDWADERMGGWREAAAAPLWLPRVARVDLSALARRPWPRGGRRLRGGALGRIGTASRASRGRPVCLWRWDPRVCLPGGPCLGPAPCLDVRPLPCAPGRKRGGSRSSRPGVRGGGRGRRAAGPGAPPREVG